ncbi:hypothetical protein ScPMuIL_013090 [Solemya velum]
MNMMKANRLKTCGKAIRRVAALFITPFLKTIKVENKYIVIDGKEEEVVPVMEFIKTESKISRWISESARHVAEVSPIDQPSSPTFQKHIGQLCKDYTIFEVASYQPQGNELGDPIYEKSKKSHPRTSVFGPSEYSQDNEEYGPKIIITRSPRSVKPNCGA